MKVRRATLLAIAIPATLLLGACDPGNDDTAERVSSDANRARADRGDTAAESIASRTAEVARESADTASEGLRSAGTAVTNASITAAVKSELMKEPALDAMSIDVDTTGDGNVTLSGTVRSQVARQRAEELARSTDGVNAVRNELVVRPA